MKKQEVVRTVHDVEKEADNGDPFFIYGRVLRARGYSEIQSLIEMAFAYQIALDIAIQMNHGLIMEIEKLKKRKS